MGRDYVWWWWWLYVVVIFCYVVYYIILKKCPQHGNQRLLSQVCIAGH